MQSHNILTELEIVGKLVRASKVGQEVDDMLLLADEVVRKLLTASLELLLGCELDSLLALFGDVLSGSFAFTRHGLALCLTLHGGRRRISGWTFKLMHALHVIKEVVAARKTVTRHSTLTVMEVA